MNIGKIILSVLISIVLVIIIPKIINIVNINVTYILIFLIIIGISLIFVGIYLAKIEWLWAGLVSGGVLMILGSLSEILGAWIYLDSLIYLSFFIGILVKRDLQDSKIRLIFKWKELPSWKKGALIFLIIGLILYIGSETLITCVGFFEGGTCYSKFQYLPGFLFVILQFFGDIHLVSTLLFNELIKSLYANLFFPILLSLFLFLFGSLIGFSVERIKKPKIFG
jgi:hypothetical protein